MANQILLDKAYVQIVTKDGNAYFERQWLEKAYVQIVTKDGNAYFNRQWLEKAYVQIVTRVTAAPKDASFVVKLHATAVYREVTDIVATSTPPIVVIF